MLTECVQQFLGFLRYNRNASPHTLRAYEADLEQFVGFLAKRHTTPPGQIAERRFDTDAVRGFLAALHDRGNSRASAARRLATLRTFARYLVREERLDHDPTSLVGAPRREFTLPAHLAATEMDRLLASPDAATPAGRRDRAVLELFYASGLRLSELVDLDLEDLNLSGGWCECAGREGRKASCRSTARPPRRSGS